MVTVITNLTEMILFQKKVLDSLKNNPKLIKLKLIFYKNNSIENFTILFNYIYKYLKCKICKIRAISGKTFNISFNFTNDSGVVLYNNFYSIKKCKNINFYSKNKNENIISSYNNIIKNVKFNDDIQNTLVSKALATKNEWFDNSYFNNYYGSINTPGTTGYGATIENNYKIYDTNTGESAILGTDYFTLPSASSKYTIIIFIINKLKKYTIIFDNNIEITYYCVGAGGGGGYGAHAASNNKSGGGGGGGGGGISTGTILLPTDNTLLSVLGVGGTGASSNTNPPTSSAGTSSTLSSTDGSLIITGISGLGGLNGGGNNSGAGGAGGLTTNNGSNGALVNGSPGNGSYGYCVDISDPSVYICGGGGGGGSSGIYFYPAELDTPTNGGNGGQGGGGGGGGSAFNGTTNLTSLTSSGGLGSVCCTIEDPIITYTGFNGTSGSIGTNLVIAGTGGNGIFGGGGGSSGGTTHTGIANISYPIYAGNGGDGLIIIAPHA